MDMSQEKMEFDELPLSVRKGIIKSIEQADRGEFISLEDVKKQVAALFEN